jgi:hypothetical protein
MSAYVVQDECINSIVTWLTFPRHEWERRQVEESLTKQGTIGDRFEEKLGNAMFELNCNAVEQRYGDGQAKEFRDLDYHWKANYHASGYAVYDRLGEYLYQCSEGDVPESSELYKALQRIYDGLAHKFFRDMRDRKDEQDTEVRRELRQRIEALEKKRK